MQIRKSTLSLLFLILFLSYCFAGSFAVYKYQHPEDGSIFSLGFSYGALVQNILIEKTYSVGIFKARRMPFIPLFLSAIAIIYNNLPFAYLIKNLIFYSLIFMCISIAAKHVKNINRYLLLFILLYAVSFPQLVLHGFSLEYGAGYLIAFFSVLFVNLLYAKNIKSQWMFLILALINCFAYLTRGVTPLLSILVCFFYFWVTRSRRVFLIFVSSLLAAILIWGTFNLFNSGKFDILVSTKGYNLYKGNNEDTLKFYPKYSIDRLSARVWDGMTKEERSNEWEIDKYFISKSLEFMKNHPKEAVKLFLVKSYVMFLKVTNVADVNSKTHPRLQCLGIIYMIIYRIIFAFCLVVAAGNIFAKRGRPLLQGEEKAVLSSIYIGFILGYSFFHLIGFANQRNVITLVPVTLFYLVWILNNKTL